MSMEDLVAFFWSIEPLWSLTNGKKKPIVAELLYPLDPRQHAPLRDSLPKKTMVLMLPF